MARSWPMAPLVTEEEFRLRCQQEENRLAISEALRSRMQEAGDLADKLQAGTATAAEQRQALVLCLRAVVRLTRLQLQMLDQT